MWNTLVLQEWSSVVVTMGGKFWLRIFLSCLATICRLLRLIVTRYLPPPPSTGGRFHSPRKFTRPLYQPVGFVIHTLTSFGEKLPRRNWRKRKFRQIKKTSSLNSAPAWHIVLEIVSSKNLTFFCLSLVFFSGESLQWQDNPTRDYCDNNVFRFAKHIAGVYDRSTGSVSECKQFEKDPKRIRGANTDWHGHVFHR